LHIRPLAKLTSVAVTVCLALAWSVPAAAGATAITQTFSSASNAGTTGTFVVPEGITSIRVEAVGGKGGDDLNTESPFLEVFPNRAGGFGAVASGNLPVVPGETLYVYVGGNGENASASGAPAMGGANSGGGTGSSVQAGGGAGGGGGASDVRTIAAPSSGSQTASLESRLLVAAAGGGASDATNGGMPGDGNGGAAEQPGPSGFSGASAQPGTANPNGTGAGGAGGPADFHVAGQSGTLGEGGAAGSDGTFQGGGGGGGLYGGGGGASYYGQPGAGGASWIEPTASNASATQIDTTGEPRMTISYEPSTTTSSTTTPAAVTRAPFPPPVAPVISGLSALHRCVTSAALVGPQTGSHGLAFSLSLSEAADVTFTVLHRVGSPAWTKCPRRRGHTPSNYKSVGDFSGLMPAGQQTTSLGTAARARRLGTVARLGRGRHRIGLARLAARRLPPGTYVLSAKAINSAGEVSGVADVKFWVFR